MFKLPFDVPYVHRPEDALQLAAIRSHPDGQHWLADHYIDLYIHKDYINEPWEGFWDANMLFACPFIIYNSIASASLINMNICLTDFVLSMLQEGNYVYCSLNQAYIPRFSSNPLRSSHGTTIYGYHPESGDFLLADFINGKYQTYLCNKSSLENAIRYCSTEYLDNYDPYIGMDLLNAHLGTISLLKVNRNVSYELNSEYLVDSLKNFLNGGHPLGFNYAPYGRSTYDLDWGLSIFDRYKEVLQRTNQVYIKFFYLLKMHKQIMHQRLQYLASNHYIQNIDNCLNVNNELIQRYTRAYLMVLKSNLSTKQPNLRHWLIEQLQEAKNLELLNTLDILKHLKGI